MLIDGKVDYYYIISCSIPVRMVYSNAQNSSKESLTHSWPDLAYDRLRLQVVKDYVLALINVVHTFRFQGYIHSAHAQH